MGYTPNHIFNDHNINAQSMGANITSASVNVNEAVSFAVHVIWSNGSTPIGTIDILASNDGSNFTSILSAPEAVAGNSGQFMFNVDRPGYGHIKLQYTRTSGSGTLDAYINAKRV